MRQQDTQLPMFALKTGQLGRIDRWLLRSAASVRRSCLVWLAGFGACNGLFVVFALVSKIEVNSARPKAVCIRHRFTIGGEFV